jgi:trigger factor
MKKAGDVKLAEPVLKRWLLASDKENTPEKVEESYPKMVNDLILHLAKEQVFKDNDLKIGDADLEEMAKKITKAQFAQYGMATVPDDILETYSKKLLQEKESLQDVMSRVKDDIIVKWIKEQVKLDTKEVTREEFEKLFS